ATVAQRRRSAHAAALAAKQRRQKILLGVLLVIVIAALAYEAPGIIKQIQGSSSPSTSVGPPVQTTQPKAHTLPKAFRGPVADPFAARALSDGDSGVAPSFGRDPFAPPASPSSASTGPAPSVPSPLPPQIVIRTPSGQAATRGWTV